MSILLSSITSITSITRFSDLVTEEVSVRERNTSLRFVAIQLLCGKGELCLYETKKRILEDE
ncbi:hypothetical protein [Marinicellulosiphila megalodicopiae]|uniref:hypothetical protein n=1 Tax=Marinicellulosiphila megalodicopiae TaxID=2724896 RepID=UPI003BAF77BB